MTPPRFPATLPVAPLAATVARHIERVAPAFGGGGNARRDSCLTDIGVLPRRYYEWTTGRSLVVGIELADRVLSALGLDWQEVWPRDEFPEFAARLDAIDAADPWDLAMRWDVAA